MRTTHIVRRAEAGQDAQDLPVEIEDKVSPVAASVTPVLSPLNHFQLRRKVIRGHLPLHDLWTAFGVRKPARHHQPVLRSRDPIPVDRCRQAAITVPRVEEVPL